MVCGISLFACLAASFFLLCVCNETVPFGKKLNAILDQNGDGQVSSAEVSAGVAVWAPERKNDELKAISHVVHGLLLDHALKSSFHRPNNNAAGLFSRDEVRTPVSTCLQRVKGHTALCTDLNEDGFVDRSEVRQNQVALYVISTAVLQKLPVADIAAADALSAVNGKDNLTAAVCAPTSTDTIWSWRSKCVENSRMSDAWIVPLINDPRSLLIWLRFFDGSSFLDQIDDEFVEKSSLLEFAFTWAFVPSYPIFRTVQKNMPAFSVFSVFGCNVNGDHNFLPQLDKALELAARNEIACKNIADLIRQNQDLLCMKETPTGIVFPAQSKSSISLKECLLRTKGNTAECFTPPRNNAVPSQNGESHEDRFDLSQLEENTQCIAHLKDFIEHQSRDISGSATVFFLFLRFLCEGWSFITLILWFRGIYRTPRFGTIWITSIGNHLLGTVSVAVVLYYFLWHVLPFFIISSVSFIFIYFIWPLGSLVLAYSLIVDGLKPATAAVINASSPRPKAPCRSPAPPTEKILFNSDMNPHSSARRPNVTPKRRGSNARAMSPDGLH